MAHAMPLTPQELIEQKPQLGATGLRLSAAAAAVGLVALLASIALGMAAGGGMGSLLFHLQWNLVYFTTISLGALFFVMLQHLTRASWSVVVRRIAENLAAAIIVLTPLLLLVAILDVTVYHQLYPWSDKAQVAGEAILLGKSAYLNPAFFILRLALCAGVWMALACYFGGTSSRQDASGDPRLTLRMWRFSAPGMLLFALTTTIFAVDVVMSVDPHWYSTIFGVYIFSGSVISTIAALTLAAMGLQYAGRLRRAITVEHYHDLGKLLFAFTFFWGYIAFSQFMLYWYADIPEETNWYARRFNGEWMGVSVALLFFHLLIPFFILLSRLVKRRKRLLAVMCVWMLAAHWLDLYWLLLPELAAKSAEPGRLILSPLALTCALAVGGLWLGGAAWLAGRQAIVPLRDPLLEDSLRFENV